VRALLAVILLGAIGIALLLTTAEWAGEEESSERSISERVMASQGFIPPGAPLKPPPRPAPRDGALALDFSTLAGFEYELEGGALPDEVASYDGKQVELIGVMYFAVADPANVTEFFLMPDHTVCCFGTPRVNQIVEVLLPEGDATEYVLDYYLIRGVLQIGPFFDEHGLPLCLYRIADAKVEFLE